MGNFLSLFEDSETVTPICPLCNKHTIKDIYIYSDLQCSQCKKRCPSYYHPECFRNYMNTNINNKTQFICYKCKTGINNDVTEIAIDKDSMDYIEWCRYSRCAIS